MEWGCDITRSGRGISYFLGRFGHSCQMWAARNLVMFPAGGTCMKCVESKLAIALTMATFIVFSPRSQAQADFNGFFSAFTAAVMSADTYQLQNLMADKFDFMGTTDASPVEVFKGLGAGPQWSNLQSAVKNKVFVTETYKGKPARFLRCTPSTEINNCYVIFQIDRSKHWRWKAMIMPEK